MPFGELPEVNRAFSAGAFGAPQILGRCPRLSVNVAPLARNTHSKTLKYAAGTFAGSAVTVSCRKAQQAVALRTQQRHSKRFACRSSHHVRSQRRTISIYLRRKKFARDGSSGSCRSAR